MAQPELKAPLKAGRPGQTASLAAGFPMVMPSPRGIPDDDHRGHLLMLAPPFGGRIVQRAIKRTLLSIGKRDGVSLAPGQQFRGVVIGVKRVSFSSIR